MGIDEYKKSKYSNSSLNDNFNTTYLSELSVGLSGADISNVINQEKITNL